MDCTNCYCYNIQSPRKEDEYRSCLKKTGEEILNLFEELEVPDKEQAALLRVANQGFCWQKLKDLLQLIRFRNQDRQPEPTLKM
ncbi:hypothetical protein [Parabacteroides sp. Marseille-P3160]|uniref:hypothetical protein n=1 Tax=Parabacteroides sp. Marseille-P3160 TaxID=1917887 RepID=UPI0009B97295|nr:hypothetical protein [Parabacteroides sp. Marseille-P3160]